jgi:hypothetical protein
VFGKKKYDEIMKFVVPLTEANNRIADYLDATDEQGYVTVEAFTIGGMTVPCDPGREDLLQAIVTAWEEKTQRILEERVRELYSLLDLKDPPRWEYVSREILPFGPPEPLYKLTPKGEARAAELAERDRSGPNPYTTPPVFAPPTLADIEQAQAT